MSVLLEALKKAAEEKKNSAKNNSADELIVSESHVEASESSQSEVLSSENKSENLETSPDDSFKFQLEPAKTSSDNGTAEFIDFDKVDNESLKEVSFADDEKSDSLAESNSNFVAHDNDIDKDSSYLNDSVDDFDIQGNQSIKDVNKNIDTFNELPVENEYDHLMDSLDEDDSFSQSLTLLGEAEFRQSNHSMLQLASEDTTVPVKPEDIDVDDLELGDYSGDIPELEEASGKANNSKKALSDESFDWSMDNLPGYVQTNVAEVQTKQNSNPSVNPILLGTANRPPSVTGKSKYQSTSFIFVAVFIALLMFLIGAYGINYYMEESESLEKSMKKYDLVGLNIRPKQAPTQQDPQVEKDNQSTSNEEVLVIVPTKENLNTEERLALNTIDGVETNITPSNVVSESVENAKKSKDIDKLAENIASSKQKIAEKTPLLSKNKPIKKEASIGKTVSKPSAVSSLPVVTINKTKSSLADGYEAYNAGDYNNASANFSRVLQTEPKNINALMGLGAIAVVNQDFLAAVQYYEQVLEKEPNNLNALEAIANLSSQAPLNEEWNKQLFIVADIYTQSAVLQNAAGNTFAKRNDWLSAQERYFKAHVNNPSNPDYMVNLAVSYDHLGEYSLASQYYTLALGQASHSRVNFDIQQVKSRLISIKQLMLKGR